MAISYEEIGAMCVTATAASTAAAGKICKLDTSGRAANCTAGDRFCGLVLHVRGGNAAVQVGGFAQMGYTGNVPAMGYTKLSADGTGGVKGDTAGTEYLVAAVDTVKKTVTILL